MEKNNRRLTLNELKAKANIADKKEILEQVKGGNLFNCHGFWGKVGKSFSSRVADGSFSEQ